MGCDSRCTDAYEQEGHIMIRVLLINALLFILPFALTYIWVRFIAAKKTRHTNPQILCFCGACRSWAGSCQPVDLSRHHG